MYTLANTIFVELTLGDAALNGDFKTIQLLISEKANIDATDKVCIEKDTQEHTTFFKYITIDVFVCCIIVIPVTFLY